MFSMYRCPQCTHVSCVVCCRYAFAITKSAEETEKLLRTCPTHELNIDGHVMDLINYSAIRDAVNQKEPNTYTKGTYSRTLG